MLAIDKSIDGKELAVKRWEVAKVSSTYVVSKLASLLKFSDVPNTKILSALPSALSKKGSPESVLAHSPVIEMADLQRKKKEKNVWNRLTEFRSISICTCTLSYTPSKW